MAAKHSMILVDWYGPFTKEEAYEVSWGFRKALYVLIGKEKRERGKPRLKYIGISETNLWRRLFRNHEKPYRRFRRSPHPWWPYVIDYFGSGWKSVEHEARLTWLDTSYHLVRLSSRTQLSSRKSA